MDKAGTLQSLYFFFYFLLLILFEVRVNDPIIIEYTLPEPVLSGSLRAKLGTAKTWLAVEECGG